MRWTEAWRAALVGTLASAGALGAAFASEWGLGLVPCALCLWERWPYRIAIALGLLALLWRGFRRPFLAAMALVLLAGAGLGVVHVGVEQGWWPSPLPECAAPNLGSGTAAERLARMPMFPAKPCDEPTYLVARPASQHGRRQPAARLGADDLPGRGGPAETAPAIKKAAERCPGAPTHARAA